MTRTTLYGTLTQDEELNENEKAMLYIKECAELVGLEVIEDKTAFSINFIAKIMKRLRKEPKTGHWISYWDEEARCHVYKCPECGNKQPFDTKHCWECGTRLIEPQERNNKK